MVDYEPADARKMHQYKHARGDIRALAVKYMLLGATVGELATETGIPEETLRRWARTAGVPPRAPGRPRRNA